MDTLQAAHYLQEDFEVLLISSGGDKDEFEATYLTEHLPRVRQEKIEGFSSRLNLYKDWMAYRRIRKALKRFKPDIVHTHTAKAGLIGRLAASAEHVPVIVHTYHGMMFHSYYNKQISKLIVLIEQWLSKKTDCIIALSETQKDQLANVYKICPVEKIRTVPLGIEINKFSRNQLEKRSEFRDKFFLKDDEIAIGIVGRIVAIKNHSFFLKVVAGLIKKGVNARFFIIGDGALRKKLHQEAELLHIDQSYFPENPRVAQLIFTSWITEIDKAIAGLDVVALTSFNEGTPVLLMEAQAAGKPVIATKTGGIDDIVRHGQTGFTVEQNDIELYQNYLEQLITNQNLRKTMGEAGAAFASAQFQKAKQVAYLKELFQSLLKPNN